MPSIESESRLLLLIILAYNIPNKTYLLAFAINYEVPLPVFKRELSETVIHQLGRGSSGPALLIAVFGETGPRYRRVSDLEAGLIG